MKIYRDIGDFVGVSNPVLTIGMFDGVHLGHRKIVDRLNQVASQINGESVVLTFDPHPRLVLNPENNDFQLLSTLDEKIALLERAGVGHLIIYPFTEEFSQMSSVDFIKHILVDVIGVKRVIIGHDHRFGRNREGNFEQLQQYGASYGFDVEEISAHDINAIEISSTKIREALVEGDMVTVNTYLGYDYNKDI